MQIKFFTIPVLGVTDYNEELNKFLRSNNIIEIEKQLLQTPTGAYWCFYISYISHASTEYASKEYATKEKIDYRTTLDAATFSKFSRLREIRKKMSIEDGISAFVICTDAELAEIAKLTEITLNNLKQIKGMGEKKVEKYGERLIQLNNSSDV